MVADADSRDVERDLLKLDAASFTSFHILDRLPAIFESRRQYADWRLRLGAALGLDPLNLVVVGSTAVGVSLAPSKTKFMRPYQPDSDVDLAIVSPAHFDVAWNWLRSLGPVDKLRLTSKETADLLKWHRRSLVFDGTIATERLLPYLPFGTHWGSILGRAGTMAPTQDRTVNARIYRDFESLRQYHEKNVDSLRDSLVADSLGTAPSKLQTAEAGK